MTARPPPRTALDLLVLAALAIVATAAALEGGVVAGTGGPALAAGAICTAFVIRWFGVDRATRTGALGLVLISLSLAWALLPIPQDLRALLAPGQAAWYDLAAPEWPGRQSEWLGALTRFDLRASIADPGPWSLDSLAGATATQARIGALAPERLPWALAQLGTAGLLYLVGVVIGRDERSAVRFCSGMVALGVAEALFGIANRNGPSTGIGVKVYYLGSATGTFINRGHFAAFLVLALGSAWGVAAGLFPLQSDEVRRHRNRKHRSSQPPSLFESAGDRIPRLALLATTGGLISVAIVASQARGPLLGFGAAAAVTGVLARRIRGESYHLGLGVGVPLVAGALSAVGFGIRGAFGRFSELLGDGGGVSVSTRITVWREGINGWRDAPWFGGGPGSWRIVRGVHETAAHLYDFRHAHNEIVEQLAELGLVGTIGLGLLGWAWLRECARGFREAPHDPRTAAGIGALVGVSAVALQSISDFPLHTPGVTVAAAVLAGLARGALGEREGEGRRWPPIALAVITAALALQSARVDRQLVATRAERVGEMPSFYLTHRKSPRDLAGARAERDDALTAVNNTPLDPWAQAALARSEARLARYAHLGEIADTGGSAEGYTLAADLAITRAERLRPLDPRLALSLGKTMLALAKAGNAPDAWKERATSALTLAVNLDSWRAEAAFAAAAPLSDSQLSRIASAHPEAPDAQSRVSLEYGHALARRKQTDAALAVWEEITKVNPSFSKAWFEAAGARRARGEDAAARSLYEGFMRASNPPTGMEGWALLYLGQFDAAEVRLRKAVTEAPGNRWAWEGLLELASRQADRAAELSAMRRIVALAPQDAAAAERLRLLESAAPTAGPR